MRALPTFERLDAADAPDFQSEKTQTPNCGLSATGAPTSLVAIDETISLLVSQDDVPGRPGPPSSRQLMEARQSRS